MRAAIASKEQASAGPSPRASSLRSSSARSPKSARLEMRHDARPLTESTSAAIRHSGVRQAIDSPSRPLTESLGASTPSLPGFDFSKISIHTGSEAAESASRLGAQAYTSGSHIVFGPGQFNPSSNQGRNLLTHELAHVAQQGASNATSPGALDSTPNSAHEAEAEHTGASGFSRVEPGAIQRKVDMRDVGKGEQSGFARVPELIVRLNAVSTGLTFALSGSDLTYTAKPGGKLSNFDTQMQGFIDQAAVIPLRFTNRHGLLGSKATGFTQGVTEDAWSSGYVDIDDLLASSELGMQEVLVHFLRERTATKNYAKRIGSESLVTGNDTPDHIAHQKEFDSAHNQGIQAELAVLQDFFSDPTIKLIDHDSGGEIFRVYRNGRRDIIRTRLRAGKGANTGVDAIIIEVVTRDGKVHTPEEYKALLAAAGTASASSGTANLPSGSSAGRGATISP